MLALLSAVAASAPALAQDTYPSRPVKLIAPQAPGGGVDLVARLIADRLRIAMGQPFVVENQAGAGGAIATQATARAQPDGYTLMIGYVATHAVNPAVKKNLGYDAVKDFTPIAMLGGTPNVLVVARAVPVNPRHHAEHEALLDRRGRPEEIASAVVRLAGPGARFTTGQTLHVNGGAYLGS